MRNKNCILILHEIYGLNAFIKDVAQSYQEKGYAVVCPNLLGCAAFPYEEMSNAYDYFMENIGLDIYKEINTQVKQLKETNEKVFIIGYSVGASIAWRCSENMEIDGIVACYGSRIREYTHVNPQCPACLVFAKESSFDAYEVGTILQKKKHLQVLQVSAKHGFMDNYSEMYDALANVIANTYITNFLENL